MTDIHLKPAHSRLAALALLAIAVAMLFSITVVPVWAVNAGYQARLDDLNDQLLRYERIADHDVELRRYFTTLQQAQSSDGHLLRSNSPMLAAAEIQAALEKVTDASDAHLVSTRILEPDEADEGNLTRVALSVRARGTLQDLVQSIHSLESNPMLLFVDDFAMQLANTRRIRGQEPQRYFEASFTLAGYMAKAQ